MSPVKEAPAKMSTGNHRTALAGQVGSSRGAAARAPDAHGGRSARIPVLNEAQTPDSDQDFAFAKLSTGRHAAGAKRMLLSAITEGSAQGTLKGASRGKVAGGVSIAAAGKRSASQSVDSNASDSQLMTMDDMHSTFLSLREVNIDVRKYI